MMNDKKKEKLKINDSVSVERSTMKQIVGFIVDRSYGSWWNDPRSRDLIRKIEKDLGEEVVNH